MSPEQSKVNQLDVDTRSDVFSLGVLLYELLTGSTPIQSNRLPEVAWDELTKMIREEEPPVPSMRISKSETIKDIAASRQTEPGKLSRAVKGELDWIVMRALHEELVSLAAKAASQGNWLMATTLYSKCGLIRMALN